tara:strand:- start:11581 stop:12210 length:630 start_codon:yes stop_codon:yes gene_type:complete
MIYEEDCRTTLERNIKYDYVLTSPPDYAELDIDPKTNAWDLFLNDWMSLLSPKKNLVTICTTDRKADGKIYPKHIKIIDVMEQNGWFLKSKKIWVKSYKVNMFRMNYMNLLTFAKKPFKVKNPHDPDVIYDEKSTVIKGFKFGMSLEVCKKLILNHTEEGDIVYDPFMGSGTTAIASFDTNRKCFGSEINPEYVTIVEERIGLGEFIND